MKLSIITCAYNAEQWINKCIKSVLEQSFTDFEYIICDDASTDNTLKVIKKYSDSRIRVLFNKTNKGAGWSRNRCIKAAKGEYIMCIDADDWIEPDLIEKMVNMAIKDDSDMVQCGTVYESNGETLINPSSIDEVYIEKEDKLANVRDYYFNNKMIRRKLFDSFEYCKRRFIEDTQTMWVMSWLANKLSNLSYHGYHYIKNDTSLYNSASDFKKDLYISLCFMDMYNFFENKEEDIYKDYFSDLVTLKIHIKKVLFGKYENLFPEMKQDLKEFLDFVEKHYTHNENKFMNFPESWIKPLKDFYKTL